MKSATTRLLLINDDTFMEKMFQPMSRPGSHDLQHVESGEKALSIIKDDIPEFIFINHKLPRIDGIEIAKDINNISKSVLIILMVGLPELDTILPLVGKTVYDYIVKPFRLDQLRIILERAEREISLNAEVATLSEKIKALQTENQQLRGMVNSIAPVEAPVISSSTNAKMRDYSNKRVLHTYQQQSGDKRLDTDKNLEKI